MTYRNRQIPPFLRLIYFFLRTYSWLGTSIYYRRVVRLGMEHLRFDGPAIVVSNHPSTLMDPLNVGVPIRQEMFFLANYGLFKNPVLGWILSRLFCIPVKRREDVAEGEERNNDSAFEQSFEHLEKNGLLYIAAEGGSWMHPFVRPFKTGAARIAFGAERRNDWHLGVKILPIGLSYSAPNMFRSEVVVTYGQAFEVKPWAEAEQKDHESAIDDLMAEIARRVSDLCIDGKEEANDAYVLFWSEMSRNNHPEDAALAHQEAKAFCQKNIDNQPVKDLTTAYQAALSAAGLSDGGVKNALDPAAKSRRWQDPIWLLLGFPFFLAGYIFWFLPCFLPWWTAKKMQLYIGYDATVKLLVGTFTFLIVMIVAYRYAGGGWAGILTLVAALLIGYLAEAWLLSWGRWREQSRAVHHTDLEGLGKMRFQLLSHT
jgi:glycerol-3-phosphate O-acyltransferase / dihydroxyacetone phosphate acyltransferase